MPPKTPPSPLETLTDFSDERDDPTEELTANEVPPILPELDDDPPTQALDALRRSTVELPDHLAPVRSLEGSVGWERVEVLHRASNRVEQLWIEAEPDSAGFDRLVQRRAALVHPGVPVLLAVGTLPNGRRYAAFPVFDETPLRHWLRRATRTEAIVCMVAIARILGAAHQLGIAHGDVGIDRIGVTATGQWVITGWDEGGIEDDLTALAAMVVAVLGGGRPGPRLAHVLDGIERNGVTDALAVADAILDTVRPG